ncbi:hypothetical protein ACWCSH_43150 [Streptosporangium sp. NPDC001682]
MGTRAGEPVVVSPMHKQAFSLAAPDGPLAGWPAGRIPPRSERCARRPH